MGFVRAVRIAPKTATSARLTPNAAEDFARNQRGPRSASVVNPLPPGTPGCTVAGQACGASSTSDGGPVSIDGGVPACGGDCCSRACAPYRGEPLHLPASERLPPHRRGLPDRRRLLRFRRRSRTNRHRQLQQVQPERPGGTLRQRQCLPPGGRDLQAGDVRRATPRTTAAPATSIRIPSSASRTFSVSRAAR